MCPDDGHALSGTPGGPLAESAPTLMAGSTSLPAAELAPGTLVGEYVVEGKLGEGAMGAVFSAKHPLIGKRAAIKVISSALSGAAEAVERFVQEARAVNQIGHPNIVDIFAFGALPDGRSYFVMEWLQGETLAGRIKRGSMTLGESADILDQVCRALEAAHEKGVIHRDLKPDNVFLLAVAREKPIVKLLDFGIAKLTGDETRVERTRTGMMMGTPLYLSPEQAKGVGVDHRTDIYALGAMAFEMIVGRPPFWAGSAAEVIAMHLHTAPPPPRSVWPAIPPALDRLLSSMLAKDPGQRPSLEQIRLELGQFKGAAVTLPSSAAQAAHSAESAHGSIAAATSVGASAFVGSIAAAPPLLLQGPRRRVALVIAGILGAAGVVAFVSHRPAARGSAATGASTMANVHGGATQESHPSPGTPAVEPLPAVAPEPTGAIFVTVDVAARVEIDGRAITQSSPTAHIGALPAGDHTIVITAPGREAFHRTVHVTSGRVDIPVTLAHVGTSRRTISAPPTAAPTGEVPRAVDEPHRLPATQIEPKPTRDDSTRGVTPHSDAKPTRKGSPDPDTPIDPFTKKGTP